MIALAALLALLPAPSDADWFAEARPAWETLYGHLHQHPELSLFETETARRIGDELERLGIEVTRGVGGHGVVGVLKNGTGPTVLFRCDLDALPIVEQTGLSFASKVKVEPAPGEPAVGVMHACGHDVHMTALVGLAQWLAAHKGDWSGTALLVAQPAEERVIGARAMIDDGLFSRFPKPDYALALHVSSDLEAGKVGYAPGPALAGATALDLTIKGRGGHGANPHKTIDPVVLAAAVILDLQSIVSREIPPIEPAVVTVGSIHGGTKHNIIPDEVKLQLTLRAFSDATKEQLIAGIGRRARGLATAHAAPEPTITLGESVPPTVNDPELIAKLTPAAVAALDGQADRFVKMDPTMGAEDFGHYGREAKIPSVMFWLGAVEPTAFAKARREGTPLPSLHSASFAPDVSRCLVPGVRLMAGCAAALMPPARP